MQTEWLLFQLESAHCQLAEARLQLEKLKVENNDLKRLLASNFSVTACSRIDVSASLHSMCLPLCSMLQSVADLLCPVVMMWFCMHCRPMTCIYMLILLPTFVILPPILCNAWDQRHYIFIFVYHKQQNAVQLNKQNTRKRKQTGCLSVCVYVQARAGAVLTGLPLTSSCQHSVYIMGITVFQACRPIWHD